MIRVFLSVAFIVVILSGYSKGNNDDLSGTYDPYSLKVMDSRSTAILKTLPPEGITDTSLVLKGKVILSDSSLSAYPSFAFGPTLNNLKPLQRYHINVVSPEEFEVTTDIGDLVPGSKYYYKFMVYVNHGYIECPLDSVSTLNSTGISEFNGKKEIVSLYPNPFQGELNIEISHGGSDDALICIYNLEGKLVKKIRQSVTGGATIGKWRPEKSLASGIYLVEIKTNKTILKKKVMFLR